MKAPPQIGDVLASKYRVERVLGSGAMGVVVAARHAQLGSLVALKFMHGDSFKEKGASARFVREARAAARLRSEHVARVGDFGTLDSGAPYIVMEFLEGADLDAVLKERGPLPFGEVAAYMMDVCKAMDEAHSADIVHRDLKPKNIFLTHRHDGTPLVKVLDFGISKLMDLSEEDANVTATDTGSILGSPAFMSPEQIRSSKHVDARADIYAMGATIFQLVTNEYPYTTSSVGELFAAVLYQPPRSLREFRPDAPEALEALVARCLKKEPRDRFANVRELMAALAPLVIGAPSVLPVPIAKRRPSLRESRGRRDKQVVESGDKRFEATDSGMDSTLLATQATLGPTASTRSGHGEDEDRPAKRPLTTATVAGCVALLSVAALGAGLLLRKPDPEPNTSLSGLPSLPGVPSVPRLDVSTSAEASLEGPDANPPAAAPSASASSAARAVSSASAPPPASASPSASAPVTKHAARGKTGAGASASTKAPPPATKPAPSADVFGTPE